MLKIDSQYIQDTTAPQEVDRLFPMFSSAEIIIDIYILLTVNIQLCIVTLRSPM